MSTFNIIPPEKDPRLSLILDESGKPIVLAGMARRLCAQLIDWGITAVPLSFLVLPIYFGLELKGVLNVVETTILMVTLTHLMAFWANIKVDNASFGERAMKIRVVDEATLQPALEPQRRKRMYAELLNLSILGVGGLAMMMDNKFQTMQDRMAKTLVLEWGIDRAAAPAQTSASVETKTMAGQLAASAPDLAQGAETKAPAPKAKPRRMMGS